MILILLTETLRFQLQVYIFVTTRHVPVHLCLLLPNNKSKTYYLVSGFCGLQEGKMSSNEKEKDKGRKADTK